MGHRCGKDVPGARPRMLIVIAVAVAGAAWAQAGRDAPEINVVATKVPSGQSMACTLNGQPCSEKVVRQVSVEASKRGVMVALAAADGSLNCTTRARKECSDDAVRIVQTAARIVSERGIRGD